MLTQNMESRVSISISFRGQNVVDEKFTGILQDLLWKFPAGIPNTFILGEPLSEGLWLTQNTLLYSLTTHCKIRDRKVGLS